MRGRLQVPVVVLVVIGLLSLGLGAAAAPNAQEPAPGAEAALGSGFTYQGWLTNGDSEVDGECRMVFRVFNAQNGGTQVGSDQVINPVTVTDGLFTVVLNGSGQFGPNLANGQERWLQISVRCGSEQTDTNLPRQALTAAPYALTALSANALRGRVVSENAPSNGQALVWNGTQWTPQSVSSGGSTAWSQLTGIPAGFDDDVDNDSGGDITAVNAGAGLTGGATSGAANLQLDTAFTDDRYWRQGGNAGTNPATDFIGTTDNQAFVIRVGNNRGLRLEPTVRLGDPAPNVIFGVAQNGPANNAVGIAIGGGGQDDFPNIVYDHYGTIGGGNGNQAGTDDNDPVNQQGATVGGGGGNAARGANAVVAGGTGNLAGALNSAIVGGTSNEAAGVVSTIGGGALNVTSGLFSFIGGGRMNEIDSEGESSVIAGGEGNVMSEEWSVIGGGQSNSVTGQWSTIGGGQNNHTDGRYAFVGGGRANVAGSVGSTIGGGITNTIAGVAIGGTVGGGELNRVNEDWGTVGGGEGNDADGAYSTVGGGRSSAATGDHSAVGGGDNNSAAGFWSTIGGGAQNNTSSNYSTVGGGQSNNAVGHASTVPGGSNNSARAAYSFAAGHQARVRDDDTGTFVWADSQGTEFESTAHHQFIIRAENGMGVGTNGPQNQLHVVESIAGNATPTNHVAQIQNTGGASGDVLALKVAQTGNAVDSSNNFMTFFNGSDASLGSIEGNGAGGIVMAGPGNDYAEWLPKHDPAESVERGEIVGVFGGEVSRETAGADRIMAVSSGAIVAGNDPGEEKRDGYALVAFIGQVEIPVRGPVTAGDFILPSGLNNGTGIAVAPEMLLPEQFAWVVGQAWESYADDELRPVRTVVGLMQQDPTVLRLVTQVQTLEARLAAIEAAMEEDDGE